MTTESTLITSYKALLELLNRQSVMHEADEATQSVHIPTMWKGIQGFQIIRWQQHDSVIQFIQSLPLEILEHQLATLESAIAHLNHVMAMPGLDLNHEARLLSFRLVMTILPRGGVLPEEVQAHFRIALQTGISLLPTLQRVLYGDVSASEAVVDARREFARPESPETVQTAQPAQVVTPFHVD